MLRSLRNLGFFLAGFGFVVIAAAIAEAFS